MTRPLRPGDRVRVYAESRARSWEGEGRVMEKEGISTWYVLCLSGPGGQGEVVRREESLSLILDPLELLAEVNDDQSQTLP